VVNYIRRNVPEPQIFTQLRAARVSPVGGAATSRQLLGYFSPALIAHDHSGHTLSTGMLAAYYSITTWLPTFSSPERHLSVAGTTGFLL